MTDKLLNVTITGKSETIARLKKFGPQIQAALLSKVTVLTLELQHLVVEGKLTGQVLNVRTGNLRRSITQDVKSDGYVIRGRVFSSGDVKYAAIHEFGGTIHMPPRAFSVRLRTDAKGELLRRAVLRKDFVGPRSLRSQALEANGAVFAKASHKRAVTRETGHDGYTINMPERSYLRSSLADMRQRINTELKNTALQAAMSAMKG